METIKYWMQDKKRMFFAYEYRTNAECIILYLLAALGWYL